MRFDELTVAINGSFKGPLGLMLIPLREIQEPHLKVGFGFLRIGREQL